MNPNNLPCISDADPGADDPDDFGSSECEDCSLLDAVRIAIDFLREAEEALDRGWPNMAVANERVMDAVIALGFPALPVPSPK